MEAFDLPMSFGKKGKHPQPQPSRGQPSTRGPRGTVGARRRARPTSPEASAPVSGVKVSDTALGPRPSQAKPAQSGPAPRRITAAAHYRIPGLLVFGLAVWFGLVSCSRRG
ncbi:hypothetical protein CC85DRAFT_199795 [Cutaneotrichosporon oleaginosum]|uniref:Uncharacterized protein n=1 Tax=Cutaneotrichosporon oleaginosum TaxID=879819 RepID=A0A0J0XDR3_9TREE|nr:uncharacterized protein CC85DRAFT_199795 [Cutaneotrichosporon oleaginosum]KLT39245.1 hypothetical protein CC85DRAFT_199795 [Cutaneotrichosporon oleaginosum]TXT09607.1 hypothetical protein COLE_03541 [Cutaneotrichosporon oleaginosum]